MGNNAFADLKKALVELGYLESVSALLDWDQNVNTVDVDFQHSLPVMHRNELTVGGGYRPQTVGFARPARYRSAGRKALGSGRSRAPGTKADAFGQRAARTNLRPRTSRLSAQPCWSWSIATTISGG